MNENIENEFKFRSEDGIRCRYCSSKNVVKRGFRKTKYQKKQIYKCNDCGRKFTPLKVKGRTYPLKYILDGLCYYMRGFTIKDTRKKLKQIYGLNVSKSTVSDWLDDFGQYTPYKRMRKHGFQLFSPHQVIERLRLYHRQVYDFKFHKAKTVLLLQEYKHYKYETLREFLDDIIAECPDHIFKNSPIMSQLKVDFDISKVKFLRKENFACKMADLVIQSISDNYKRHNALQKFMLNCDSTTVGVEVPVFIEREDVEHMREELGFIIPINYSDEIFKNTDYRCHITGHIDILQIRNGAIHILDYKPNASSNKPIAQLTLYALAMSRLTGLRLFHFKCAWFDRDDYFEFFPLHIVHEKKRKKKEDKDQLKMEV